MALNATLTGSTITPTSVSSTSTSSLSTTSASSSERTLTPPRRLRGSKKKTAIPDGTYSFILGNLPFMVIGSMHARMMPGPNAQVGGQQANFNYRIPPAWSPEHDRTYSFRAYMTDISLWVMLTDLAPHQQTAAIIMRLGGQAR